PLLATTPRTPPLPSLSRLTLRSSLPPHHSLSCIHHSRSSPMSAQQRPSARHYEPVQRQSFDSEDLAESDRHHPSRSSWLARFVQRLPVSVKHISNPSTYARLITPRRKKRSLLRLLYWSFFSIPYVCLALVILTSLFFPSYTHRPAHYNELRKRSLRSSEPGRANLRNEKIFIVSSLYEQNGEFTSGAWGQQVLKLVDLLGPDNVYLSIYENNPDDLTRQSLLDFEHKLTCKTGNSTIFSEDFDMEQLPRVTLPNGEKRIKRIAFLAEVRNRALAPLDKLDTEFDRILYINDVNFDPIEAAQLLFATNVDDSGRASYSAACAVDFINPFKFYDRFATRDLDGNRMGVPFFPWFTSAGSSTSRRYTLANSDAIPVRSCWGGMTAFEAKWFQSIDRTNDRQIPPIRFRSENDTFWDSSECCLVHADLAYRRTGQGMPLDSGIYMNPYIRVAYDMKTLSWLSLTRRPEKLYSLVQEIVNRWAGLPIPNERQTEEPGQPVTDKVWVYDDPVAAFKGSPTNAQLAGHFSEVQRIANPGGFCGGRMLLILNPDPKEGESKWGNMFPPQPTRR
ncbi:cryptococcal mannosyltransferase 1-domain-containing protein, partial [Dendryphion nanum]